ncbi:MAG: DegT/DnrJ/EryC1/StrS family aminotransferase [Myxococcaceae bacterium]
MPTARPYVPAQPTLGWAQLRAPARPLSEHPFSAASVSWTHLGRSALHLAARVLGLEGKEVLVPAYHHGIEVEALLAAGAHPTFYEVGRRWALDLEDLEGRIGHRTGGLVLTHFAGFPGPASQVRALADRYGLVLIEDCAQALLSTDGAIPVGTTGDAAVFSLRKTLPVPHGGALVFNGLRGFQLPPVRSPAAGPTARGFLSRVLLRGEFRLPSQGGALRRLGAWLARHFGSPRADRPPAVESGFDRQQLAMGASPLVERVARAHVLASVVERRRRNFFHLLGALRGAAPPLVNERPPGVCPLFYPLWVGDKDEVLARLRAENVEAGPGWRAFHSRCDGGEFPEASRLRKHVLELPCHQDLGPAHVAHLARVTLRALSRDRTWRSRAAGG